jgi:murein DD-endopeptidase MepM/ murein hydrolase activator NlpD/SH3-like domain-containing protein
MIYSQSVRLRNLVFILLSIAFLSSCGGSHPIRETFRKQTPYEKYEEALQNARLDETALGRDWIAAGQKVLKDSLVVTIPFKETGYFAADKATAVSYRFNARRGQQININVDVQAKDSSKVFVDLFELEEQQHRSIAYADTINYNIAYEVKEDGNYMIRLQPELLRSGRYTIAVTSQPTLAFPVHGKNSRHIASFWGNDRDGGKRKHEGIDIFALRGTPALASVAGYISRVNENRLGGKVVWLNDSRSNQTLYYAHLDTQLVSPGQRVKVGDTLGLIGNTGNARTTDPHLHFGIYRFGRGAVDPLPYVLIESGQPKPVTANLNYLGALARISVKRAIIRSGPTTKANKITELPQHTPLFVFSGAENWYRIELPDGLLGYVSANLIEPASKPLRQHRLDRNTVILDHPDVTAAPLDSVKAGNSLAVLAQLDKFLYVQAPGGTAGWLQL